MIKFILFSIFLIFPVWANTILPLEEDTIQSSGEDIAPVKNNQLLEKVPMIGMKDIKLDVPSVSKPRDNVAPVRNMELVEKVPMIGIKDIKLNVSSIPNSEEFNEIMEKQPLYKYIPEEDTKSYEDDDEDEDDIEEEKDKKEDKKEEKKQNKEKITNNKSTSDKLIEGVSGVAMGIGASKIAASITEKKVDEESEQKMKEYLNTFKCAYGNKKNIKGGDLNIDLPGGNELISIYTEYKELAENIREMKKSLGIKPGIESEVIFDKADTNLYENESNPLPRNHAFASISNALRNPDGDAKFNAQKAETDKNLKIGIGVAAAGLVVGVAGKPLVNVIKSKLSEKENNKESADTENSLKDGEKTKESNKLSETENNKEASDTESNSTNEENITDSNVK